MPGRVDTGVKSIAGGEGRKSRHLDLFDVPLECRIYSMLYVLCLHIGWARRALEREIDNGVGMDTRDSSYFMHYSELARTTHKAGRFNAFADEGVKSCECDTCIRHRRYLIESQTLLTINDLTIIPSSRGT